jgi:alpha-tubulin suppressor-like RCC1 family protein
MVRRVVLMGMGLALLAGCWGSPIAPLPVTGLEATATVGSVTLTWTPPLGGFYGVTVRRGVGSTPPASPTEGTLVGDAGDATSMLDSGLSPATTYSYALFTYGAAGSWSSAATVTIATEPEPIPEVVAMSAGSLHHCALYDDGTARCWGANGSGRLGDGTTTDRASAVPVEALDDATALAAGQGHTCALLEDTTVKCWGHNGFDQLGHPTPLFSTVPVPVLGLTGVVALAAGEFHTCALLADSTARCWGVNDNGQLGDGTTDDAPTPVTVSGLTNAVALTAGGLHTCALLDDATARCWGDNSSGQLGDGTTNDTPSLVAVSGLADATALSAGADHTCARQAGGTLACWGRNQQGQLGNGSVGANALIPSVVTGIASASQVAAGGAHTCARLLDGTARCWGHNAWRQLGNGSVTDFNIPDPVVVTGTTGVPLTNLATVLTGGVHTCGLLEDSTIRCWGRNSSGQLGSGAFTVSSATPLAVVGL